MKRDWKIRAPVYIAETFSNMDKRESKYTNATFVGDSWKIESVECPMWAADLQGHIYFPSVYQYLVSYVAR